MRRLELLFSVLQVPIDFFLFLLAAISAYALRFSPLVVGLKPVAFQLTLARYLGIVGSVGAVLLVLFAIAGLYAIDPNRRLASDLYRVFLAASAVLSLVALYLLFRQTPFDSRFLVAATWGFAIVYISSGRLIIRGLRSVLYRLGIGARRVVVIGKADTADPFVHLLKTRKSLGYQVVAQYTEWKGFAKTTGSKMLVDEIIFISPHGHEDDAVEAIRYATEHQIVFKYSADVFAAYASNSTVRPIAGIPIVEIRRTPLEGWGRVIKRLADLVGSIILIVVLSPLMLVIALLILIETGRPVIYKNERIGARGQKFFTLKFRSMYQKDCTGPQFGASGKKALEREAELIAEHNTKTGPIYKIANDPRVTPFGRFLRRVSLDELPQLFNVLGGSMSLVGPRPHQPREVAKYDPEQTKVFGVKPGITGLAQISGRSDLSFEEEARLDVLYMEQWSLWLDAIIFIKTPFTLFRKRKAL